MSNGRTRGTEGVLMAGSIRERGENSWEIQIMPDKDLSCNGEEERIYKTVRC